MWSGAIDLESSSRLCRRLDEVLAGILLDWLNNDAEE